MRRSLPYGPSADIAAEDQEASVDRHRTAGMTAIAVLNMISGVVVILAGLLNVLGVLYLLHQQLRLGVFESPTVRGTFALLLLATGIVGLIAGFAMRAPRPWARTVSLVYAGLLIASSVLACFIVPILATIGTYDITSVPAEGLARLIVFGVIYVLFPVPYAIVLCVVFCTTSWKAVFAKGGAPGPALAPGPRA